MDAIIILPSIKNNKIKLNKEINSWCSSLNLNSESMVALEPPDPSPCSDLQMVLVLCRDLEDTRDGCGSMGDLGMSSIDTVVLGSGGSTGGPPKGGQMLANGSLTGWKNALMGSSGTNAHSEGTKENSEDPKIAHGFDGPMISLPDSLMDSVTSGLKLCVVARFVAFRPTIEMVRKWVS